MFVMIPLILIKSALASKVLFRLDALALSVIATATWLAGCLSQPVLYQND